MRQFKPGTELIPGYRLVKFLGKGQFGQVWETTAPGGGAAALKFLDLSGKQGWKEFRGIQRVKRLRHTNLMPITALWLLDEDGEVLDEDQVRNVLDQEPDVTKTVSPAAMPQRDPRWLVVAQLLGEGTLADELERCQQAGHQGIPVETLLKYMEEAAKGIDYLNASHRDLGKDLLAVQHCDIKPANILLLGGSALVCDFGVAQVLRESEDAARATGMTGSPAYMPPECSLGRPSAASDQYSLAISYVELRTGELPFEVQTPLAVLDAHRSGNLALSKLSKPEQAVIRRATALDPKKRYRDCQTMVAELRQAALAPSPPRKQGKSIALGLMAAALLALFIPALRSLRPTLTTYAIEVEPQQATVLVNGEPVVVDQGVASVSLDPNQSILVEASSGSDYEARNVRLDLREFDQQVIRIKLERSASYWSSQALQLLEQDADAAAETYARAIRMDQGYARFPEPITLKGRTEGAELRPIMCSGDGHWLVGAGEDGKVLGWKITTALTMEPRILHEHSKIRCLAVGKAWVASAGDEGDLAVTPLGDGSGTPRRFQFPEGIDALSLSASDDYLAIADGAFGVFQWAFLPQASTPQKLGSHTDAVEIIAFAADTAHVFTASWDGTLRKWRSDQPATSDAPFATAQDDIEAMALSTSQIAYADHHLVMVSGQVVADFKQVGAAHQDVVGAMAFSRDGAQLGLGGEDGTVTILRWRGNNWTEVAVPDQHIDQAVNALAFDPLSQYLFSVSNDKTLVLWDADSSKHMASVVFRGDSSTTAVCVATSGRWLFCETADGHVHAWDLRRLTMIKKAAEAVDVQPQPAAEKGGVVEA